MSRLFCCLAESPVPHDITLPLPADGMLLQAAIVVLFLAHIVFVNLMLGGSIMVVVCEILGLKRRDYDALAREIAYTITVNKSLAVVLGVGPLLAINVLYTVYFYSANALTGMAWIGIVPLVTLAFLVLYLHKYTWETLADRKILHIAIGAVATLLLLMVPLIFLANINLMLFPDRWDEVKGFISTLSLPNVLPRYLHFLAATLALTSLFCLGYLTRRSFPIEARFEGFDRPRLRKIFYRGAFVATFAQLLIGPLVYFTLPTHGITVFMTVVILTGATFALGALGLMWAELLSSEATVGRFFAPIVCLIMLTGGCMGYGRHLYREGALMEHRDEMNRRTGDYVWAAQAAQHRLAAGVANDNLPLGARIYRDVCSSCHAVDRVLAAPPITEIATIYPDNPAGIVAWTKAPGRKRTEFSPMPAFANLSEKQLFAVADHMLELAQAAGGGNASDSAGTPH